ncbi:hypothetical protein, partial [Sphingobacterium sp. IITKGP-BTPF85]|uniref:hypothetical protein n=1 Tax=Sphingobacterium sp. IITKGP-BTPF85 TaxID=1338009 RepID=UPI00056967AE
SGLQAFPKSQPSADTVFAVSSLNQIGKGGQQSLVLISSGIIMRQLFYPIQHLGFFIQVGMLHLVVMKMATDVFLQHLVWDHLFLKI